MYSASPHYLFFMPLLRVREHFFEKGRQFGHSLRNADQELSAIWRCDL